MKNGHFEEWGKFLFYKMECKNCGEHHTMGEKLTFYCHPGLEPGSVITDSTEKKLTPAPIRLRSGQALAGVTNAEMNVTGSCSYEPKNCKPIN